MENFSHYEKEVRPWGSFERFTLNEASTVKIVTVHGGQELSLQQHMHRDEGWRIIAGTGRVVVGAETQDVKPGDEVFIDRGTKHRVAANAKGLTFLEISFGDFDEGDITRFEDRYGRA